MIKKIVLNSKTYEFGDVNYVYGSNHTGKTYLYNILDYILCGEIDDNLKKDNIHILNRIEVVFNEKFIVDFYLNKNENKLIETRYINKTKCSGQDYQKKINREFFKNTSFDCIKNHINFTFRQSKILNFFPETHLGDLLYIFPKNINRYKKTTILEDTLNLILGIYNEKDYEDFKKIKEIKKNNDNKQKIENEINDLEKNINEYEDKDIVSKIMESELTYKQLSSLINSNDKEKRKQKYLNLIDQSYLEEDDKSKLKNVLSRIDEKLSYISEIKEMINDEKQFLENSIDNTFLKTQFKIKDLQLKLEEIKQPEDVLEPTKNKQIMDEIKKTFNQYFYYFSNDLGFLKEVKLENIKLDLNDFSIEYSYGSHAYRTMIQLLFIFTIHDVINNNKREVFPLIVLDSYSQPFDDEKNIKFIFELIKYFKSKDYNKRTQIICLDKINKENFISINYQDNVNFIDISDGLF